jgi:hypothetical protein
MKTLTSIRTFRVLISLLAVNAGVFWGAPAAANPVGANVPVPTPYAVVSQDANSRIWKQTVYEHGPSGQEQTQCLSFYNEQAWLTIICECCLLVAMVTRQRNRRFVDRVNLLC